jgi:hypothetical protein
MTISNQVSEDSQTVHKLDNNNPYSIVKENDLVRYPKLNELPSTIGDKFRPIIYIFTALRAETKYVLRKLYRELRNLLRLFDLLMLFLLIIIGLVAFFFISVYGIPFVLSIFPESIVGNPADTIWGEQICKFYENGTITYSAENCAKPASEKVSGWPLASGYVNGDLSKPKFTGLSTYIFNLWVSDTTLRIMVGVIGGLGVAIRLLFKSDIDKFKDKVTPREDVTYVFGSTIYAEKFLTLLTHTFASADEAALISDANYLWVERIAGLLDTYISEITDVKTTEEFAKPNLYELIGFKNAKRIFILTDSVERNQNILTNIRSLRPDVPIYILSQYTPEYLKGDLIKDENLFIIDDTEITRDGLVKSLSLDIKFPLCSEINVPRNYVGKSPLYLSNENFGLEVLAVKRPHLDDDGWDLLLPDQTILQRTDRLLLHITNDFKMKEANRIVTELPVRHLADLGELKYNKTGNRYITGKITEIPGRALYLEPKSARKSWQRRVVGSVSLLLIIVGIAIGRKWLPGIGNLPFGLTFELVLIISGVIGLFVYRSMHPILLKGIIELDKFEKTYLKRQKSFKRGSDIKIDISKMKVLRLVIMNPKRGKKQFRHYYLIDQEDKEYLIYSILWKKDETNNRKIQYLKRFENRLESYTELKIQKAYQEADETIIIDEDPEEDLEDIIESKMSSLQGREQDSPIEPASDSPPENGDKNFSNTEDNKDNNENISDNSNARDNGGSDP